MSHAQADRQHVWVTGLGACSALGPTAEALAEALEQGRSGVRRHAGKPERGLDDYVAAAVTQALGAGLPPAQLNLYDRSSLLSLQAAQEAWAQAGLPAAAPLPLRAAVAWGTGLGGAQSLEQSYTELLTRERPRIHPYTVLRTMGNASAAHLALRYQLRGGMTAVSNACASSAQAIGEALRQIRRGEADIVLAGGAEAMLQPGMLQAWQAMGVMARPDPEHPEQSCRPFDRVRAGLVLGEGAAALVLESEAHARARGARPLAELAGYGTSCDAVHLSRPDADGQLRAMRAALDDAGLHPAEIGYVNAHGTATEVGDAVEAASLAALFGPRGVPVSATKALHGHLLGGGGALELVAALQALRRGRLPATAHLRESELDGLVDLVRDQPRSQRIGALMSNSFAFGGSNAVLVARAAA